MRQHQPSTAPKLKRSPWYLYSPSLWLPAELLLLLRSLRSTPCGPSYWMLLLLWLAPLLFLLVRAAARVCRVVG